ncbi:bifunctional diaminohydroxyphosphoribosylaminopyrimidine deaminase/5-amino-6-(5-phosphoribosylamino)uracil reductase RibD [Magnetovibrio sp.]|uniref:bifunctional diaminohydroxyphosphoribosylaminopyrimidine deaminase/5-amino-6-(5-phosphoribosylamino)uracil reductase RibD n=1 Tax=Magnetovibrio sp. TaxID=2024836 RepID=UPI002F93D03F
MSKTNPPALNRDEDFLRAALRLARRGLGNTAPNPAVGCILVKDAIVVGRGWTQPGGRPHAEAMALAQAGDAARGATAYVTLEPCAHHGQTPPCANALVDAGVARVVVAISDPDERVAGKGLKILKDAGIEVVEGILRDEAWRANLGFFKRITENRPAFTLKLATSHDGRIPPRGAQGDAKWITSPEARARGHLLRAQHDAVLFGIGTVLDDDPTYTCRLQGLEDQSPVRILLDSKLALPDDAKLLSSLNDAPLWIVCGAEADSARMSALEHKGATVIQSPDARPDPVWVAHELAQRGLNRVLIEAGPGVVSSFLKAGLVDEIDWFRAEKVLGAHGVPAFHDFELEKLALAPQAVLQAGPDKLEIYALGD